MKVISGCEKTSAAGDGGTSTDHFTYHDLSLDEICSELRAQLEISPARSWLSSLGYCESYMSPPVQRVAYLADRAGRVQQSCFYNQRKWAGLFKELEIVGAVEFGSELVRRLCTDRQPDLLTCSWQTVREFPQNVNGRHLVSVRRMADDFCIELPASAREFLQQLGKQTRKHLPYYLRRLEREWPRSWRIEAHSGPNISWELFRTLLELNRLRMRGKGMRSSWTRHTAECRWRLAQKSGLLLCLKREERLVAGTFSFLHNECAYLIVIAHDPKYDRLNLGSICLWKTIEHLIHIRCQAFHLLWGASFYKTQFDGRYEPINQVTYASGWQSAAAWRLWNGSGPGLPQLVSLARKVRRRLYGTRNSMSDLAGHKPRQQREQEPK